MARSQFRDMSEPEPSVAPPEHVPGLAKLRQIQAEQELSHLNLIELMR